MKRPPGFLTWTWPRFYREISIAADLRGLGMLLGTRCDFAAALDEIPLAGAVQEAHVLAFAVAVTRRERGIAPATDLLVMKRPDYFVHARAEAEQEQGFGAGLCRDFGVAYEELSLPAYWSQIIRPILKSPWWNAPRPEHDGQELGIGRCRAYSLSALYIVD